MHSAEYMWVFAGNLETWKEPACSATAYLRKVCSHGGLFVLKTYCCFFYLIMLGSVFLPKQLLCIFLNGAVVCTFTRGHVEP